MSLAMPPMPLWSRRPFPPEQGLAKSLEVCYISGCSSADFSPRCSLKQLYNQKIYKLKDLANPCSWAESFASSFITTVFLSVSSLLPLISAIWQFYFIFWEKLLKYIFSLNGTLPLQGFFMKRLFILLLHLLTMSMAVYQRPNTKVLWQILYWCLSNIRTNFFLLSYIVYSSF